MWTKIFRVLNIIIIITMPVVIVYQLFIAEKTDIKLVTKAASLLIVYLLAMLRIRRKTSPLDYLVFEEQYKDVICSAFNTDKGSYRRLMTAIGYYNGNKQNKAIELLDRLYGSCEEADDYAAVLFFKALCLSEQNRLEGAAACYEEILTHKRNYAKAWSNLGTVYQRMGKAEEAFRAYREAVAYNPQHAAAYCNIANYYVTKAEPENAIEYALKSIELDSKMYQAMSAAAMAYKMLGDEEKCEKYCRMYGANGGDAVSLRQTLDRM